MKQPRKEQIYVKLTLMPFRVLRSCYRLVRSVVREVMPNAIDGRRIGVDKGHKFLNYLLQGSAATMPRDGWSPINECLPPDGHQLSFIHDELNYECYRRDCEQLAKWLELAAKMAGEYYNLRCPIAAEAKIGQTWADVH